MPLTLSHLAHAIVAALAVLLSASAGAHDGAQLFDERCAKCHSEDKVLTMLKPLASADAVRARLEALLPRHHAVEHADHEPIIVYLLSRRVP